MCNSKINKIFEFQTLFIGPHSPYYVLHGKLIINYHPHSKNWFTIVSDITFFLLNSQKKVGEFSTEIFNQHCLVSPKIMSRIAHLFTENVTAIHHCKKTNTLDHTLSLVDIFFTPHLLPLTDYDERIKNDVNDLPRRIVQNFEEHLLHKENET